MSKRLDSNETYISEYYIDRKGNEYTYLPEDYEVVGVTEDYTLGQSVPIIRRINHTLRFINKLKDVVITVAVIITGLLMIIVMFEAINEDEPFLPTAADEFIHAYVIDPLNDVLSKRVWSKTVVQDLPEQGDFEDYVDPEGWILPTYLTVDQPLTVNYENNFMALDSKVKLLNGATTFMIIMFYNGDVVFESEIISGDKYVSAVKCDVDLESGMYPVQVEYYTLIDGSLTGESFDVTLNVI